MTAFDVAWIRQQADPRGSFDLLDRAAMGVAVKDRAVSPSGRRLGGQGREVGEGHRLFFRAQAPFAQVTPSAQAMLSRRLAQPGGFASIAISQAESQGPAGQAGCQQGLCPGDIAAKQYGLGS
jgi:hypothetical protein